ncbi:MAG: glycine cleavage system protein GcvH [Bacteriovoracaceae bacterium]
MSAKKIPSNLKYTVEHEWADVNGDIATIGITDFAQSSLGDIVFVELPAVGDKLEQGSTFGVVESIKSVSDLFAPFSGEVLEVNNKVVDSPELLNNDAYSSWMIKIKISDKNQLKNLLDAKKYEEHCETAH